MRPLNAQKAAQDSRPVLVAVGINRRPAAAMAVIDARQGMWEDDERGSK
jgi:hypothetical protein